MILNLTEELPPLTKEEVRQVFINTLDLLSGFSILFLQCSPAEASRLIPRVRQEFPKKNIEVLDLVEPIDNLYKLVEGRADRSSLNILFIRGLEKSLEADIKPGYKGLGDYYNLNTVPSILSHLNQQRENFRDHFGNISFVFVLPEFAIRYFIRRAPDFYDWNSGVFKISDYLNDSERILAYFNQPWYKQKLMHMPKMLVKYLTAERLCNQGIYFDYLGEHKKAITSYEKATLVDDGYQSAWINKGTTLTILNRYEEAIISFDKAIAIDEKCYEAYNNKGIILDRLGRSEEAISVYQKAISIKKTDSTWINIGVALDHLGRYEEAIKAYEEATLINKYDYASWNNMGNSLCKLGKYKEAINSYKKATFLAPNCYAAWDNMAEALKLTGCYIEAIDSYEQAITLYERKIINENNLRSVKFLHLKVIRYFKSIIYHQTTFVTKPNISGLCYNMGMMQFITDNYLLALLSWQKAFRYINDSEDFDVLEPIQEFIEELIPRFTQPSIEQTLLIPLLEIYKESNVITELGTALVNTLHLIVAPTINDHTANQWLSLWRTSSLGNEPAMELPLRLMNTAIEYKKDPSKRDHLWLNLPSEERHILDKVLKI
jgi:tetratricopeptide (TPR) repeat protein